MGKIVLVDEMDVEQEFELLATFGLDDYNYAALIPISSIEEDTFILRIEQNKEGEMILVGIEDDEELNDAILAYEALLKEKNEMT